MFIGILFCNINTMIFLIAFLAILIAADLFKRHLLSNPIVYAITMLIIPFALFVAVATPVFVLSEKDLSSAILHFALGILLLALAAVIYVRGHIIPVNKSAIISKYGENVSFYASKRLIVTGSAVSVVYGILFVTQLGWCGIILENFFGNNVVSIIQALLFWVLLMFVPFLRYRPPTPFGALILWPEKAILSH